MQGLCSQKSVHKPNSHKMNTYFNVKSRDAFQNLYCITLTHFYHSLMTFKQ